MSVSGIWRFAGHYDPWVPPDRRLTLGEGATPALELPALAAELGLERLVLKREDLNPTGSHKDRGAAFQVSVLAMARPAGSWLVISSSGNAAIAAAAYAALGGLRLAAFVAPGTPASKTGRIRRLGGQVFESELATSLATETAGALGIPNLRPSVDPLAVEGFLSLGWELLLGEPVDAVFTFASSGTSLVGIGRAFSRAADIGLAGPTPSLHVVQGSAASPIAGPLDSRPAPEDGGRLGAFGATKTRRLGEAVRLVRTSGGRGWVTSDAEAERAQAMLAAEGILVALEAAASLAAAARATRELGLRSAAVVLTGRADADRHREAATRAEASGSVGKPSAFGESPSMPEIIRVEALADILRVIGSA